MAPSARFDEVAYSVMSALGVLQEYRHIRKASPEAFEKRMWARPRFIFDPSLTPDKQDKKVLAGLNRYLGALRFGAEPLGDSCRLTEYSSVALMLVNSIDGLDPEPSSSTYVPVKRVKDAGQRVLAAETYAREALADAIQTYLVEHHYRLDGRRYWATSFMVRSLRPKPPRQAPRAARGKRISHASAVQPATHVCGPQQSSASRSAYASFRISAQRWSSYR